MIATNEAVDVLRHGWQDAASTLAADVPEVAELLQARLEMAIATDRLDEIHLLDTIQEVESVTSRAGSPSGQALARRLRRTVYEYLLALDAARPLETAKAPVDQPARVHGSPMVGAEEVAALGHASRAPTEDAHDAAADNEIAEADVATAEGSPQLGHQEEPEAVVEPADKTQVDAEDQATTEGPASRRRFVLRRRQRHAPTRMVAVDPENESGIVTLDQAATLPLETEAPEPNWRFTPPAEPAMFDGGLDLDHDLADDDDPAAADVDAEVPPSWVDPGGDDQLDSPPLATEMGLAAAAPSTDTTADVTPTFVAPRAGFHIVEDAPPHRVDHEESRLEMPAFTADEGSNGSIPSAAVDAADGEPNGGADTNTQPEGVASTVAEQVDDVPQVTAPPAPPEIAPGDSGDFLAWRAPIAPPDHADQAAAPKSEPNRMERPVDTASSAPPPVPAPPEPASPPPPVQSAQAVDPEEEDGESRGWGVRKHGEVRPTRRGVPALAVTAVEDDPFENNTRLSEMRRRIEERLRRKRCDEAAALLQEIAQETGGRAVAELAMNAGDRCRTLGKANAALNCYLAAARSDPVYELPLSRLADICIDNQDTELAVSYLERIARIYRFREEDRAALRTYRRIATIAPHREDVLTLLMNAQRTGQLE